MKLLDIPGLTRFMSEHLTRTAFRLETLDKYTVPTDLGNFERYLAGEPTPNDGGWKTKLANDEKAGRHRYRVHVVRSPLSDYLRYECEWGYAYNAQAGEEIHILDVSEVERPDGLIDEDFWLIDNQYVLKMHYDDEGHFLGAEEAPESELAHYRHQRDLALQRAVPFDQYWEAHLEYWRENWLTTNVQPKG